MKTRQLCIAMTAILFGVLAAQTAEAAPPPIEYPPACSATLPVRKAYETGLKQGEFITQAAWNNVKDCNKVDQFIDILFDNVSRLTLAAGAGPTTVCRYAGTIDGVYNKLDTLYTTCSDQCFNDGEFIGAMTAQIYCDLSIALGGLAEADDFIRGPVQICGLSFEFGCDSSFISNTEGYPNPLDLDEEKTCLIYTVDPFSEVYNQARNNQCAYDPEPDPAQSSTGNE